jgi:hypothetical protein
MKNTKFLNFRMHIFTFFDPTKMMARSPLGPSLPLFAVCLLISTWFYIDGFTEFMNGLMASITGNTVVNLSWSFPLRGALPPVHVNSSWIGNQWIPPPGYQFLPRNTRISYNLLRGLRYNNTYNPWMRCELKPGERSDLHPTMKQARGVLDFSTTISTNLKLLVMGDSVAIQFSQVLQEATGADPQHRRILRQSWGTHEGLHVSAPICGGGVVGGGRMENHRHAPSQS